MKIQVDFMIFSSATEAFGAASGSLDLQALPSVGDNVGFLFSANGVALPDVGFSGFLSVSSRVFSPGLETQVLISLSDAHTNGLANAKELAKFLEKEFGLVVFEFGEHC